MKRPLAILLMVAVAVIALAFWYTSQEDFPTAYVNTFDECEGSSGFGELFADDSITFIDKERTQTSRRIPHGTLVEIIEPDPDFPRIRLGSFRGYIPSSALSTYNPADGVQPDPNACAS